MTRIRFCTRCAEYTLSEMCPRCGAASFEKKPPKYSPQDRTAKYRREARKQDLGERGLF